jgi:hypothetical protein
MTTPGIAANAYAQLARVTEGVGNLAKTIGDGTERNGPDFAAVLKQALGDVAAAGRKSDAEVGALATGRAGSRRGQASGWYRALRRGLPARSWCQMTDDGGQTTDGR